MRDIKITVAIPTYNRAYCITQAIDAALGQSYHNVNVLVIDDGSTDDTERIVRRYADHDNFCYVKLGRNVGTAQAKNVAIMLADCDAITFHDSDDIPEPHKLLMQVRALTQRGHVADSILDWGAFGHEPGAELRVDFVVGAHKFIKLDGSVHIIQKRISLVDDFFPHLQFPSKTEGDWILINSGLFRADLFCTLGGYLESVEEDRELRNRLIGCGYLAYYLEEPLLTKIEMNASLTVDELTGYRAGQRRRDRQAVWDRKRIYFSGEPMDKVREQSRVEIDLPDLEIARISNPAMVTVNRDVPATSGTLRRFAAALDEDAPQVVRNGYRVEVA